MDELVMMWSFWPFFLMMTGLMLSGLLRFVLNGGILAPQTEAVSGIREKTGFETEYLLGHLSSYTLRMVKVD